MSFDVVLQHLAELYNIVLMNIPALGMLLRDFCGYIGIRYKKK